MTPFADRRKTVGVKALPALLYMLLLGLAPTPALAGEPDAPQSLPIIYDQPGEKYLLRIDNRRYESIGDKWKSQNGYNRPLKKFGYHSFYCKSPY